MKAWIGNEVEGTNTEKTLFLESSFITEELLKVIKDIERREENVCKRLYLGANKKDVVYFEQEAVSALLDEFEDVRIETSFANYITAKKAGFKKVIIRFEDLHPEEVTFKIDTGEKVFMYEQAVVNTIDKRCKETGMYNGDRKVL